MKNVDLTSKVVNRRGLLRAGISALAAGLLLKVVGSDKVMVERVYAADGSAVIIGAGNTGSSITTLSSPVTGGPAAYFVNSGTGDAQAIQGNMTGTGGRAFVGFASATSGSTIAMDGVCNSPSGIALRGANTATTGVAIGVQGQTSSSTGACIIGKGPGGGEVFRVRGDGNVGIGTTTPNPGAVPNWSPVLTLGPSATANSCSTVELQSNQSANTAVGAVVFRNTAMGVAENRLAQIHVDRDGANDAGTIRIFTKPSGSSISERMRIDTNGRVGIGTPSPSAPLHVKYPSANVHKETPAVIIDNPTDGEQTVLQFSVDGSEMGRIRADKVGDVVVSTMANGNLYIRNQDLDTSNLMEVTPDVSTSDGQTALLIRRNIGGSYSLQRVSMGAVDSGGSGYRVLRVAN